MSSLDARITAYALALLADPDAARAAAALTDEERAALPRILAQAAAIEAPTEEVVSLAPRAPVFRRLADRALVCATCGQTHLVTNADWHDERGARVPEAEAILCAHYRADLVARTERPFRLFNRATSTPTVRPGDHVPWTKAAPKVKSPRKRATKAAVA